MPSVSKLSRQYGLLDMAQFSRPFQPATRIALIFTFLLDKEIIIRHMIFHMVTDCETKCIF